MSCRNDGEHPLWLLCGTRAALNDPGSIRLCVPVVEIKTVFTFLKFFFSSVPLGVGGGSASWEGDPQAGSSSVHVNDEELPAFDIAPSTRWHGTGFCAGPTRDIRHLLQCGNWRDEKEIIPSSHSRDTNTPRLYLLSLCLR